MARPSRTARWSSAMTTRITRAPPARRASRSRSGRRACCRPRARAARAARRARCRRRRRRGRRHPVGCASRSSTVSEVWSVAVAEHDGRGRAGRVAGDVGERLLGAAVEREARVRRKRARAALDRQRHVGVRVVSEGRRRATRAARRSGSSSPRSAPTACRAFARPSRTSSPARSIAARDLRARLLALGELARALQLDRRTGERVGEHVVELARDPAALRHRRRPQLLLAGILELGEQQLGRVLARARLLDEVGDQREQRAQQRRGEDAAAEPPESASASSEPGRHTRPRAQLRARNGRRATAIHTAAPPASSVAPRGCSATSATPAAPIAAITARLHDDRRVRRSCLAPRARATPRTRPARPRLRAARRARRAQGAR